MVLYGFRKTEFFYFLKYSLQIYLDVYFQEIQNLKHSMYKLFVMIQKKLYIK